MDEPKRHTVGSEVLVFALGLVALAYLGWDQQPQRYLLFHTLAELFSIVVAVGTFMVVWNSRRFLQNGYILILGVAGLFIAGIDILHMLSYKGLAILPFDSANVPTQLWIAARYLQAATLLVAPLFIRRRVPGDPLMVLYGVLAVALSASILFWGIFPDAFAEGSGLTLFKNASEFVIIAMMMGGLVLLVARRDAFEPSVLALLVGSIVLFALAEGAFTMYASVYGRSNMVGHLLRIVAAYLLYSGLIVTSLSRPYDLLFRELKQNEEALRDSEERFRTVFEQAQVGIGQLGLDGRFLLVNDRLCEIADRTREEIQTMRVTDLVSAEDREADVAGLDRLLRGEYDAYSAEKRYALPDGSERWVSVTRSMVRDAAGRPESILGLVEDIHARKAAESSLRRAKELSDALIEVDAAMNSSLDRDEIMGTVVRLGAEVLGVPQLAIAMREGAAWRLCHVSGESALPAGTEIPDESAPLHVLAERTREPVVVLDSFTDPRAQTGIVQSGGFRSYMAVPLVFTDEVLGVLGFGRFEPDAFPAEEVAFATQLAASVTLALENARLFEIEHRIADTLQEALISPAPQMPGLELAHLYRSATEAARVGGDFYDIFEVGQGVVGIIVGDVSGKGIGAAAMTAVVKTAIKANASAGGTPAEVMDRVNDFLRKHTSEAAFVTVFYGTLDLTTGALEYCSGGHPPAVVRRADGAVSVLHATSPLVGAFEGVGFCDEGEHVGVGDSLVLYTDGVIECRGPEGQFGEERLVETVASWDAAKGGLPAHVLEAVHLHCGGVLGDDVAVVVIARS